jgi:Ca2+:H+ antiporter
VSIIALLKNEVILVKTSLIGSILSNLLLVMGMCFFFGGLRREEQFFNVTVATTAASLLAVAVAAVIVPSTFQFSAEPAVTAADLAALSRGVSVVLLVIYACYLYFQLKTHSAMYQVESQKVAMRPRKNEVPKGKAIKSLAVAGHLGAAPGRTHPQDQQQTMSTTAYDQQLAEEDDEDEEPQLHLWVAIGLLGGATVVIAFCAEFMVDSISEVCDEYKVSPEFVGLILLPIVGNAAEHATAVTVAVKDKMDLAIGVAVGSSMQVALLIVSILIMSLKV